MSVFVRKIQPGDEPRWRELWDAYTRFYQREPDAGVTRHTWSRTMDPDVPVYAVVAQADGGEVLGIADYVIHENTSTLTPVCYLEDLFVDPTRRGESVGKQLIDWLLAETKAQGWSRLYWHTKENNYRARSLYDKYTPHSASCGTRSKIREVFPEIQATFRSAAPAASAPSGFDFDSYLLSVSASQR